MDRIEIDESEVEITTLQVMSTNNDVFIEFNCDELYIDYMRLHCDTEVIMFRGKKYRVREFDAIGHTIAPGVKYTSLRLHLKLSNSQKRQDKIDELLSS